MIFLSKFIQIKCTRLWQISLFNNNSKFKNRKKLQQEEVQEVNIMQTFSNKRKVNHTSLITNLKKWFLIFNYNDIKNI